MPASIDHVWLAVEVAGINTLGVCLRMPPVAELRTGGLSEACGVAHAHAAVAAHPTTARTRCVTRGVVLPAHIRRPLVLMRLLREGVALQFRRVGP